GENLGPGWRLSRNAEQPRNGREIIAKRVLCANTFFALFFTRGGEGAAKEVRQPLPRGSAMPLGGKPRPAPCGRPGVPVDPDLEPLSKQPPRSHRASGGRIHSRRSPPGKPNSALALAGAARLRPAGRGLDQIGQGRGIPDSPARRD